MKLQFASFRRNGWGDLYLKQNPNIVFMLLAFSPKATIDLMFRFWYFIHFLATSYLIGNSPMDLIALSERGRGGKGRANKIQENRVILTNNSSKHGLNWSLLKSFNGSHSKLHRILMFYLQVENTTNTKITKLNQHEPHQALKENKTKKKTIGKRWKKTSNTKTKRNARAINIFWYGKWNIS